MQHATDMSVPTDFFALYGELGIDPECTPEDFKRAYRRRVAELHPDRSGDRLAGEEALKNLNLGYAAALDFLRTYGRLPGAPAAAGAHAPAPVQAAAATRSRPCDESGAEGAEEDTGDATKRRHWLRLALAVLAIAFAFSQFPGLYQEPDGADAMETAQATPAAAEARTGPAPEFRLEVGMPSADILASLGAPTDTARDGRQWHYGPSWILLTACDRVHDWYSSPLKPLGESRRQPDPDERQPDARQDLSAHCADGIPGLRATL